MRDVVTIKYKDDIETSWCFTRMKFHSLKCSREMEVFLSSNSFQVSKLTRGYLLAHNVYQARLGCSRRWQSHAHLRISLNRGGR